jgi:hypothetical protein
VRTAFGKFSKSSGSPPISAESAAEIAPEIALEIALEIDLKRMP